MGAASILDLVRVSVTVNCSEAAVRLLRDFFKPMTISRNRLEIVRIQNRFHQDAATTSGYRDIVLNVHFDGGPWKTYGSREIRYSIVGEVQIVLEDFIDVRKRMVLLQQYMRGDFDHKRKEERRQTLLHGDRQDNRLD